VNELLALIERLLRQICLPVEVFILQKLSNKQRSVSDDGKMWFNGEDVGMSNALRSVLPDEPRQASHQRERKQPNHRF
jgi:hypothetical protein